MMLSVKQISGRLGVSEKTVRKLVKEHSLKAIRVGMQLRISEESLAEYIRRSSV